MPIEKFPRSRGSVIATDFATVLGDREGPLVSTAEHVLAARRAYGRRHNATIEVDGPEVPIMDGSSAAFVAAIDQAGIVTQSAYPVVDVKATLFDGSYHDVDSSEIAFKIAGSMAFKAAMRKASPVLLEPIMSVEVVVPEEFMGDVIGDISSRRGKVLGMDTRPAAQAIDARVPLAQMFGYATDLRSMTQGRATYTMQFSHYEPVPAAVAEGIIAKFDGKSDDDV